jgi:prepilin-type processing-associated H-X9-DG protein
MAILALLFGLSIPGLTKARSAAQRAGCQSNLRQIGIAALNYAFEHGQYTPAYLDSHTRWMDLLVPYLGKREGVYLCPSDPKRIAVNWDPSIFLSYGINVFRFGDQEDCFWYGVKTVRIKRPNATILYADCTPGKYYCGGGSSFSEPVVDVGYRHSNKSFVAAFCDGHVEVLTTTTCAEWDASR